MHLSSVADHEEMMLEDIKDNAYKQQFTRAKQRVASVRLPTINSYEVECHQYTLPIYVAWASRALQLSTVVLHIKINQTTVTTTSKYRIQTTIHEDKTMGGICMAPNNQQIPISIRGITLSFWSLLTTLCMSQYMLVLTYLARHNCVWISDAETVKEPVDWTCCV